MHIYPTLTYNTFWSLMESFAVRGISPPNPVYTANTRGSSFIMPQ